MKILKTILNLLIVLSMALSVAGCDFEPNISTIEAPSTMGPQPFSTFQADGTIAPIGTPGTPAIPTYPVPIPPTSSMNFGVCSNYDELAGNCMGDKNLGFRELEDGQYQFFLDGFCYLIESGDDADAAKKAIEEIQRAKEEKQRIEIESGLDGAALAIAIAAVIAVCIVEPTKLGCALAIAGFVVATGVSVNDMWNYIEYDQKIKEYQEVVKTVLSGAVQCP